MAIRSETGQAPFQSRSSPERSGTSGCFCEGAASGRCSGHSPAAGGRACDAARPPESTERRFIPCSRCGSLAC